MKFTNFANAQKKAELILLIVVLMFLLNGCVTVNRTRGIQEIKEVIESDLL
jgi:hypothetical protein